jgi:hypothetical protein
MMCPEIVPTAPPPRSLSRLHPRPVRNLPPPL